MKIRFLGILLYFIPILLNGCAGFLEAKQKEDRIDRRKNLYIEDGKTENKASSLAREDVFFQDMRQQAKDNWVQQREANYISSGMPEMDAKRQAYRDWWRLNNDPDFP